MKTGRIFLVVILCILLVGCGGSSETSNDSDETSNLEDLKVEVNHPLSLKDITVKVQNDNEAMTKSGSSNNTKTLLEFKNLSRGSWKVEATAKEKDQIYQGEVRGG